ASRTPARGRPRSRRRTRSMRARLPRRAVGGNGWRATNVQGLPRRPRRRTVRLRGSRQARQRFFARSRRRSRAAGPRWRWAKDRAWLNSFVPSPIFAAAYPEPAFANSQNGQQPYSGLVHSMALVRELGFGLGCASLRGWAAFCTGLSPAPRPRGAGGKAIDSSLK